MRSRARVLSEPTVYALSAMNATSYLASWLEQPVTERVRRRQMNSC
jgi:hypothetical protein